MTRAGPDAVAHRTLTIGTRASKLALAQTALVQAALQSQHPHLAVAIAPITTKGDMLLDRPLAAIGDKGLFIAEIEAAVRAGRIDLAVHSAKDLPSERPADMRIGAYLPRADARDVLVSRAGGLHDLPPGARVGTSSPRRACQVRALRPDLVLADVRGNVDTRLRKLAAGEYDALVLAAAGLDRLGLTGVVTEWLHPDEMLPAVGQGALAVEVRADDSEVAALLTALDDPPTRTAVTAERGFLAALGAGCTAAVAAYATVTEGALRLTGLIGAPDGRLVRGTEHGDGATAPEIGARLAAALLRQGGAALLEAGQAVGVADHE
jgi:hydroxymethylbilane synthase